MSNKNIEEWKTIQEEPRYQISNLGNVKSLIGEIKLLTPTPDESGYLRVKLSRQPSVKYNYNTHDYRVHRLVAKYFCENYADNKEVHHKDLNRQNNAADNLICLTKSEHIELHKQLREQQQKEKDRTAAEDKEVETNENSTKPKNNNGQ